MIEVGRHVRIGQRGVSVFVVNELDDAGGAIIESVLEDAPGRYPFRMRVRDLVPADD